MSYNQQYRTKEPGVFKTLRNDIEQENFLETIRREWRELKDYYLDEEKKARYNQMNWIQRGIYMIGWLLKGMFYNLNPFRRLLVVTALILFMVGGRVEIDNGQAIETRWQHVSVVVLLLIIMLELKDKMLAHDELEAGRKIQRALTPKQSPKVEGWDIWLFTRSANEVGGDLVDFLHVSDSRKAISIADIAGKGLKAALLTAKLQATIRALASEFDSLTALVAKVNTIFHRDSLPNIFASLVCIEIEPNSGVLRFVNAGHLPPLLISSRGTETLSKGALALGLRADTHYEEFCHTLAAGDVFFAFSDGLTECCNTHNEFYGTDRLLRFLPTVRHLAAEQIGNSLLTEIERFSWNTKPHDDITVVILKKT